MLALAIAIPFFCDKEKSPLFLNKSLSYENDRVSPAVANFDATLPTKEYSAVL